MVPVTFRVYVVGGRVKLWELIAPGVHKVVHPVHFHTNSCTVWWSGTRSWFSGAISYKSDSKMPSC
jgi:hypothetical protein